MTASRRYSIDENIRDASRPIEKEEQRRILQRLLEASGKRLTNEEYELMKSLLDRLDTDSQRIRRLRDRVEGSDEMKQLLSMFAEHSKALHEPPKKKEPGEIPRPEERREPEPAPAPAQPRAKETLDSKQRPARPREPRGAAPPFSPAPSSEKKDLEGLGKRPLSWSTVTQKPQQKPASAETRAEQPTEASAQPQPSAQPQEKVEPQQQTVREPEPQAPSVEAPSGQRQVQAEEAAEQKAFSPVEVVERYISAWNQKAFAVEYQCFSPTLMKMDKEDYVNRRMSTYLSYNKSGDFKQKMGAVLKKKVGKDRAEVLCQREVNEFHQRNRYLDYFVLRLEGGQWRITGVTTKLDKEGVTDTPKK